MVVDLVSVGLSSLILYMYGVYMLYIKNIYVVKLKWDFELNSLKLKWDLNSLKLISSFHVRSSGF